VVDVGTVRSGSGLTVRYSRSTVARTRTGATVLLHLLLHTGGGTEGQICAQPLGSTDWSLHLAAVAYRVHVNPQQGANSRRHSEGPAQYAVRHDHGKPGGRLLLIGMRRSS
jgi:hypothetical protein